MKFPERVSEQRRQVVDRIVADMEGKELSWAADWAPCWSPVNAATGKRYHGGNRLGLAAVAAERGLADPRWCTYRQAEEQGWHVRKGAKAAVVEKWKMLPARAEGPSPEAGDAEPGEGEAAERLVPVCVGYWSVFNARDVEGIPPLPERTPAELGEVGEVADQFIESSRCPVREAEGDEAYYAPSRDVIVIPERSQFATPEGFLSTLLHEMTHSTAPELGRKFVGHFGSPEYAREELVAELGSMFAAADAGLDCKAVAKAEQGGKHYDQHVAYLESWVAALRKDPDELYRAAAKASTAAEYLGERRRDLIESRERDAEPAPEPDRGQAHAPEGFSLSDEARDAQDAADAAVRGAAPAPEVAIA